MSTPHDELFRTVFARPEQAQALLVAFLSPELVAAIDWNTLELLPGSFVDESGRDQFVDLLFSVTIRGEPVLLYLLLEHKSAFDPLTALQVLGYVVQIWRNWRREHPGERLPRVLPIVVHHGTRTWDGPTSIGELLDREDTNPAWSAQLESVQPHFRFVLVDLARYAEEQLAAKVPVASTWLVLCFFQFVRGASIDDTLAAVVRWRHTLLVVAQSPGGDWFLRVLWSYVLKVTDVPADRLRTVVSQVVDVRAAESIMSTADKLRAEGRLLGKVEGKAEGRAEGRLELVLRLLESRFAPLSEAVVTRVRAAGQEELDQLALRTLHARSIGEIFSHE